MARAAAPCLMHWTTARARVALRSTEKNVKKCPDVSLQNVTFLDGGGFVAMVSLWRGPPPSARAPGAGPMPTRLLIIDDDTELTGLLRELLGQQGFQVEAHQSGVAAASRASSGEYSLVILDVMLPGRSSQASISRPSSARSPRTPVTKRSGRTRVSISLPSPLPRVREMRS